MLFRQKNLAEKPKWQSQPGNIATNLSNYFSFIFHFYTFLYTLLTFLKGIEKEHWTKTV